MSQSLDQRGAAKQEWEVQYQHEQASKLGLNETMPSLDAYPELKRMMEIFMVSWSVTQSVYKTVNEDGEKRTVLDENVLKNRAEREFFELFQKYLSHNVANYARNLDLKVNPQMKDNLPLLASSFAAFCSVLALLHALFEKSSVEGDVVVYGMAVLLTAFASLGVVMHKRELRENIEKRENGVYGRDFRFDEVMNFRQFVGEGAPLRMISDFYATAQAIYKAEKVARTYLESPDAEVQKKGTEMIERNKELAKKLVRFASVIEARLRSGGFSGSPDKAFDSLVRLQKLAGETTDDAERMSELEDGMKEVEESLASLPAFNVPNVRVALDNSTNEVKPRIIDAEFEDDTEEPELGNRAQSSS